MGLILTATAGLGIWIIAWAFGVSGFDGFIVTAFMTLLAIAASTLVSGLLGRRG